MQNKKNNKVGFRTYRKKMAAMLLVGMLAVSTAATGCGKKDVDYDVDGNGGSGSGSNADSGSLQGKYFREVFKKHFKVSPSRYGKEEPLRVDAE